MRLLPSDDSLLMRAVADTLVVAADPDAAAMAPVYWHKSRPWLQSVTHAVRLVADQQVTAAAEQLMAHPRSFAAHHQFRSRLTAAADRDRAGLAQLLEAGWAAECNSRIGYHIGSRHADGPADVLPSTADLLAADLLAAGAAAAPRPSVPAPALIVIPFRDSSQSRVRLRNLVACLRALAHQSAGRQQFRITVVESDTEPRGRRVLAPLCDQYVFAHKAGPFNKSWAVNVGFRHSADGHEVLCVLDADVLPDQDFVRRNIARFRQPGVQAVQPFQDVLCLDVASTEVALTQRLPHQAPDPDRSCLRGFILRRPPGLCIWLRSRIFETIGGMDERYEGWGGEDRDFALRISASAALDRHNDPILHLWHPSSASIQNGVGANSGLAPMTWPRDAAFGEIDRFGASLAGSGRT
jgi:N-terminal domain of galactosyltransferase/Glycosyl transferase family 2